MTTSGYEPKTYVLRLRISPSLKQELEDKAQAAGMPPSTLARHLLHIGLRYYWDRYLALLEGSLDDVDTDPSVTLGPPSVSSDG